jgi:hypothetical protein
MTLQFIFDPPAQFVLRHRCHVVFASSALEICFTSAAPDTDSRDFNLTASRFVALLRYHWPTPVWRSSIRRAQSHDSATRGRLHRAVLHSMLFYYSVVFSVEVLTWLRLNSMLR